MISFDIFDTLITRKTFSPGGIFLVLQNKLNSDIEMQKHAFLCQNFRTLRMNAEKDARIYAKANGIAEITLAEIYSELQVKASLSSETVQLLIQMEMETEIKNSYPIRKNIDLLKQSYFSGEKVVLISDMYLPEKVIRKILIQWDDVFKEIPIYVSSEYRATKGNGLLFFKVSQIEHVEFKDWVHYGDNKVSDYLMPRMLGIDARLVETQVLTSWERDLYTQLQENLTMQYFIGAAKIVRMEKEFNTAAKIGGSLGGMLLYPYIAWIIRNSMEKGIKRLYFVARDGYVLKIIADEIIKNQSLDIKTKYIYGSRHAWRTDKLSVSEKSLMLQYMEQEINFSDENYAFVDLHGSGYTMKCLADFINEKIQTNVKVFYYDLFEKNISDKYEFFSFSSQHTELLEVFCRAPHGATIGYFLKENQVVPQLTDIEKNTWQQESFEDYIRGIRFFTQRLSNDKIDYNVENIELVELLINYCKNEPCKELVDFIASVVHDDRELMVESQYAPALSLKEVFLLYMWRTLEPTSNFYKGTNLHYALLHTDKKVLKWKMFFEKHYLDILGKMVQLYKNRKYLVKKNKQKTIILYGAGNLGKRMRRHLMFDHRYHVLAWTDMNPEKYAEQKVVSLNEALGNEFDYIIIALASRNSYNDVSVLLEKLGIDKEKIISYEKLL